MCENLWRLGLCVTLGFVLLLAAPVRANAQEGPQTPQEVVALFEKGIRLYNEEAYEEAVQAFEQVLASRPSSQVALQMRDRAELGLFAKMSASQDKNLAATARKILGLLNEAARQQKRQVRAAQELITGFQSPKLETYLDARAKLLGHGPYAIPYLLQFMTGQGARNQMIAARTLSTIAQMGRAAVPPLVAALSTDDDVLRIRVAATLAQIGDRRALPGLLALYQDPAATDAVKQAVSDAISSITGQEADSFGPAVQQYADLIGAYLAENAAEVGYAFGDWQEIWRWDASADELSDRLTYVLVPCYLYYQCRAEELALDALSLNPAGEDLRSLLLTALSNQLALARVYAEHAATEELRADARERLEKLEADVPLVAHLYGSSVVGGALKRSLGLGGGTASHFLIKMVGQKVGVVGTPAGEALVAALDSRARQVRYRAAVEIVKASPNGELGDPKVVMQVLSAALKQAATDTVLVAFTDLQMRNKLTALLEELGLNTVSCDADAGSINVALSVQPSVDVVLLQGNVEAAVLAATVEKLTTDARTRAVPLYVVIDPRRQAPEVGDYAGITRILNPDELVAARLGSLLEEDLEAQRLAVPEDRADVVLLAAQALQKVDPSTTAYPLQMTEAGLIAALRGYGEEVSMAATMDLAAFGSAAAIPTLAKVASAEQSSTRLKAAACRAIAAVAARSGVELSGEVVSMLKGALESEDQHLREAAAEALSVAGLKVNDLLALVEALASEAE